MNFPPLLNCVHKDADVGFSIKGPKTNDTINHHFKHTKVLIFFLVLFLYHFSSSNRYFCAVMIYSGFRTLPSNEREILHI